MPKIPIDYSKIIIYRIVSDDLNNNELTYVGHTTNFTKRKGQHKDSCNNERSVKYNYPVYKTIRENGGWNSFKMIEIEKYPCNDMNEASARERYWLEFYNAKLNKQIPTQTKKEYCELNKEVLAEYQKAYYENNKGVIAERKKEYCKLNKEKIAEYSKSYCEEHKEEILEKQKAYYEKNKEVILERNKAYRELNKNKI